MPLSPIPHWQHLLLTWFDQYGRKDLPWQVDLTPYRVWVSEIMLQQTQVSAVIPYFQRFMACFPDLASLAKASQDEVLQLWAGLGYYARARNLHRTAQIIQQQYQGKWPRALDGLMALPGVGRSTAGAISALALQVPQPILDGNVKRVLTRTHGIAGWPGQKEVEKQLWQLATAYTPTERCGDYTQAMMDLGAMVCIRGKPKCTQCPLQQVCWANLHHAQTQYPQPKPRTTLPVRATQLLLLHNSHGRILLEKRPELGIWGGLWSLPEYQGKKSKLKQHCCYSHDFKAEGIQYWPAFRHTFTHFHLDITPILIQGHSQCRQVKEEMGFIWCDLTDTAKLGSPAPVKRLLQQLTEEINNNVTPNSLLET